MTPSTENAIYGAVESAVKTGVSAQEFIKQAREAWAVVVAEQAKDADDTFKRAQEGMKL